MQKNAAMDSEQHIHYWHTSAQEDWRAAEHLAVSGMFRHALFFAHLALEKALKGHIYRDQREVPPRIHNLVRLAELTKMKFDELQRDILSEMTDFNLSGRYPEMTDSQYTAQEAEAYLSRAREVLQWLIHPSVQL